MFTGILNLYQGDYFSFSQSPATDAYGNIVNLSGLTGAAYLKIKYGDSGVLDKFNFKITNTLSGSYSISLLPTQTSTYPINQGIYGVYVFNNILNSGTFQAQIAQGYINVNPELVGNFSGLFISAQTGNASINSPENYFGASSLTISGTLIYNDGLTGNQGYKTTRVIVQSGAAPYTGLFELSSINGFIGATLNYIISMPPSINPTLIFQNTTGTILTQSGISVGSSVFIQFGFDGNYWQVNQWA